MSLFVPLLVIVATASTAQGTSNIRLDIQIIMIIKQSLYHHYHYHSYYYYQNHHQHPNHRRGNSLWLFYRRWYGWKWRIFRPCWYPGKMCWNGKGSTSWGEWGNLRRGTWEELLCGNGNDRYQWWRNELEILSI